jgi:hypothetical protein
MALTTGGDAELDVALVAVNVVRDQTGGLFPAPSAPAEPPAPSPAPEQRPPPAAQEPRPSEPLEAVPWTPVGVDFVPLLGWSTTGLRSRTFSLGALGALSGGIDGTAVSGLANVDLGPVRGAEIGGLVNVASGPVRGAQIAGLTNVAGGAVRGAEIAGLASVATKVDGAQISGLLDVAGSDSSGLQLSLVNVAGGRLHGAQIGLVNVAKEADAQIGLLNVDVLGRLQLDAWTKPEAGMVLAGLKHGSPHFHSIYAFEMNVSSGRPWAVFGLGPRLTPSDAVFVDIDVLDHVELVPTSGGPNMVAEARAVVGVRPSPYLSVFAGPTFNVLVATNASRADLPGYATHDGGSSVWQWPGVAVGVEGL